MTCAFPQLPRGVRSFKLKSSSRAPQVALSLALLLRASPFNSINLLTRRLATDAEAFEALLRRRSSGLSDVGSIDLAANPTQRALVATTLREDPQRLRREAARRRREEEAETISEPVEARQASRGGAEGEVTAPPLRRSKRMSQPRRDAKPSASRRRGERSAPKSRRQRSEKRPPSKPQISDDDDFVSLPAPLREADELVSTRRRPRASAKATATREPPANRPGGETPESSRGSQGDEIELESQAASQRGDFEGAYSRFTPRAARERGYAASRLEREEGDEDDSEEEDADRVDSLSSREAVSDGGLSALLREIEKLKRGAHERKTLASVKRSAKAASLQTLDYLSEWLGNAFARCDSVSDQEEAERAMESIASLESDAREATARRDASLESARRREESLSSGVEEARSLVASLEDDLAREDDALAKALERLKAKRLRQVEDSIKLASAKRLSRGEALWAST